MRKCNHCNKPLVVGDEAHIVDNTLYCSKECAVISICNHIICSAKELATEYYSDNAAVLTVRLNHDTCTICGKDLTKCDTIWAAEGMMFCSRDCGVKFYTPGNHAEYGEELFDQYAEEVNPKEIGLGVTDDEA